MTQSVGCTTAKHTYVPFPVEWEGSPSLRRCGQCSSALAKKGLVTPIIMAGL